MKESKNVFFDKDLDSSDIGYFMRKLSVTNTMIVSNLPNRLNKKQEVSKNPEDGRGPNIDENCLKSKYFQTFKLIKDEFPSMYKEVSHLATTRIVKRGEVLFIEGGCDNRIYFLMSGKVALYKKQRLTAEERDQLINNYKETAIKKREERKAK